MTVSSLSRRRFLKLGATGAIVVVVAGVGAYLASQQPASQPAVTPKTSPTPVASPSPTPVAPTPTISPREKMVADAIKEGTVNLYTSHDEALSRDMANAFEKKYPPIKVEIIRSDGAKLVQRYLTERRAGKDIMDLYTGGPDYVFPGLEEGMVESYRSPEIDAYPAERREAQNRWAETSYTPQVIGYNVNLVKGADIPTSYGDLLKPRFKDKIGLYSPTGAPHVLLISRRKIIGEARWTEFVKSLNAQNPKVIAGSGQIVTLLKTGEIEVALWVYTGSLTTAIKEGAPLDYVRRKKTMVSKPNLVWLNKYGSHPNTARLLYDFHLSKEGQEVYAARGAQLVARPGVEQKVGLGVGTGEPVTLDMVEVVWPFTDKELDEEVKSWNTLFGR